MRRMRTLLTALLLAMPLVTLVAFQSHFKTLPIDAAVVAEVGDPEVGAIEALPRPQAAAADERSQQATTETLAAKGALGATARVVTFAYDDARRLTKQESASGEISYAYDEAGNLIGQQRELRFFLPRLSR